MIRWFKEKWKKIIAFSLSLWPAVRLFLRWPVVAVTIATIPLYQYLDNKFNLPPVTSKIIGFALFALLLFISWHFAELIVIFMAVAFVSEMWLIKDRIKFRIDEARAEAILNA